MRATRNLLSIVPPYFTSGAPPLGPASLLAYLRANGHDDFDFLDLRLWVPNAYAPTYRAVGVFGETYVMDVPDLPLVLGVLENFGKGAEPLPNFDELLVQYCLDRGISVSVLQEYLIGINRFLAATMAQLPNLAFVGFSTWSSNYLTTLMAAAHLKKRKNPPLIVLGGPQTTESKASAKLALRSGLADFVALGEGEETLLQLYEAFLAEKGPPDRVMPGTMRYNGCSGSFETADRPLLRIENIPLPAFDKMPLMSYQRRNTPHRAITYELSRGCTDKCIFCSEWVFWKNIRVLKVDRVVDGILRLQKDFGCDVVWFMDSLLNANLNRLRQLGEELLRRDVRIKWGGYLRANVDRETAALIKRAGCEFVFVGVESLSDETLKLMHKRRTGAENINALEALLDGGVNRVVAGFIPGFPGDTRARFTSTALMLGDIHHKYPGRFRVNVEPFTMSPMQPMYGNMTDHGLEPILWEQKFREIGECSYQDITADIFCSVNGPNQGMDRLGELRVAQTVTATTPVGPDPFLYYEGEMVTTTQLRMSEMAEGWYMGLMKTDSALVHGLILSREERLEYERLEIEDTAGYGFGYGRKGQSSLFGREPFSSFLQKIADRHLVPPRQEEPALRRGLYLVRLPRAGEEIDLSPFVVVRSGADERGSSILVVDVASARWHQFDVKWLVLFQHLAKGPLDVGALPDLGLDAETVEAEIKRLIELGVLWNQVETTVPSSHDSRAEIGTASSIAVEG